MSIAFRDLPVYDLTGATRNFEQLVSFQFKGKALEGGLEEPTLVTPYSKGVAELTFAAGAKTTVPVKVKHLLGKTPTVVLCTPLGSPAFEQIPLINVLSPIAATEFEANAEVVKAFVGETKVKFSWLAVA